LNDMPLKYLYKTLLVENETNKKTWQTNLK